MVSQPRTNSRDDDVTMTPIHDEVIMQVQNAGFASAATLDCPHCDFKCDSTSVLSQHTWEQHPLLMRRKKHLINIARPESGDELSRTCVLPHGKDETAVVCTRQTIQDDQSSECAANVTTVETSSTTSQAPMDYREKAMRSISLLSTAAAILESQTVLAQERPLPAIAVQKPEDPISASSFSVESVQPFMTTPLCRAYVSSLNQYVTIPINMPSFNNPNAQNSFVQYLQTQQHRSATLPQMVEAIPSYSCYPTTKPQIANLNTQSPLRQPTEAIRNLLTANNAPTREKVKVQPTSTRKSSKGQRSKQSASNDAKNGRSCPLGEERRKQLEAALLSMDCCDINDSSTTMPFKCPDGVWRMVKFKCIKGLWVVQTPDSDTPTVYVPYGSDKIRPLEAQSSCNKRKLSDKLDISVDAKRLCASAPVLSVAKSNSAPATLPLKRSLSNPFVSKRLPAPSQYFTNNEGKRVNISVVKHSTAASSSDLIKSLLLRKSSPTIVSSPSGSSSTSSAECKVSCRRDANKSDMALSQSWLKSSMAF